jgi:hypothetical protein
MSAALRERSLHASDVALSILLSDRWLSGNALRATVRDDSATRASMQSLSSDLAALHASDVAVSILLVLAHHLRQQVRAGRARAAGAARDKRGRFLSRAALRTRWHRDEHGRFKRAGQAR